MRSSTSSSDERLPRGGWGRSWLLALLLTLGPLAAWEGFWRLDGHHPQVFSDDEAWILQMMRVRWGWTSTVVLGTSRIQTSLDPDEFQAVAGGNTPADLAIAGNAPLPILEFIADSTPFKGLVVFEAMPFYTFDGTQGGAGRGRLVLARYANDKVSPARLSEAWLRVHLLQHFTFREPQLLPSRLARILVAGRRPDPSVQSMRPDRFAPLDQRGNLARHPWNAQQGFTDFTYPIALNFGRPATPAEYAALVARLERAADKIQARGGRVAFLYIAGCGLQQQIEERRYPRATYWDPFAHQTRAIALATADYLQLNRFDCWDGSHVDIRDTPAYSRHLATILRDTLNAREAAGR